MNSLFFAMLACLIFGTGCVLSEADRAEKGGSIDPFALSDQRVPSEPDPTKNEGGSGTRKVPSLDANYVSAREFDGSRVFDSPATWSATFDGWMARRPPHPGIIAGIRGFSAAIALRRSLDGDEDVINDKWKHCMVGSEITLRTGTGTAEFAAWLKEYQDLTDALPQTRFDERDYEATMDGSKRVTSGKCVRCSTSCESRWGSPNDLDTGIEQVPRGAG